MDSKQTLKLAREKKIYFGLEVSLLKPPIGHGSNYISLK